MKIWAKLFITVLMIFSAPSALAIMGADLEFKEGADEKIALSDFENAVALSGGRVNSTGRGNISAEGDFPELKTRASATIKTQNSKKVIVLRVQAQADLIEFATGFTAKKETDLIKRIMQNLEQMGYKNLPQQ